MKDSITAVEATGVVVALVVNLAVFFINDGSKGSCTAGRQEKNIKDYHVLCKSFIKYKLTCLIYLKVCILIWIANYFAITEISNICISVTGLNCLQSAVAYYWFLA